MLCGGGSGRAIQSSWLPSVRSPVYCIFVYQKWIKYLKKIRPLQWLLQFKQYSILKIKWRKKFNIAWIFAINYHCNLDLYEWMTLCFNRVQNYSHTIVSLMTLWNLNTTITETLKSLNTNYLSAKIFPQFTSSPFYILLLSWVKMNSTMYWSS